MALETKAGDIELNETMMIEGSEKHKNDRKYIRIVQTGHTGKIYSISYSTDGAFVVSGSCDKTVRLVDVDTGEVVCIIVTLT